MCTLYCRQFAGTPAVLFAGRRAKYAALAPRVARAQTLPVHERSRPHDTAARARTSSALLHTQLLPRAPDDR